MCPCDPNRKSISYMSGNIVAYEPYDGRVQKFFEKLLYNEKSTERFERIKRGIADLLSRKLSDEC